jgi:hypothetical protein
MKLEEFSNKLKEEDKQEAADLLHQRTDGLMNNSFYVGDGDDDAYNSGLMTAIYDQKISYFNRRNGMAFSFDK